VGCGGWDMPRVRGWVERRVLQLEGFADQIIIDAVCRRLEEAQAHPRPHTGPLTLSPDPSPSHRTPHPSPSSSPHP